MSVIVVQYNTTLCQIGVILDRFRTDCKALSAKVMYRSGRQLNVDDTLVI